jgi:diguanylate cyclase (GGDEF)-like protein/PAS domain S-box-containing protein
VGGHHAGRASRAALAGVLAAVSSVISVLAHGGVVAPLDIVATALVAGAGLAATTACVLRARASVESERLPWALLALACAVEVADRWVGWLSIAPPLSWTSPRLLLHLAMVGLAVVAVRRLRAPSLDAAAARRTALDAATLVVAVAIVTGNAVFSPGAYVGIGAAGHATAMLAAAADVALGVKALLALSRARYPGGTNLRTLLPLAAGLASLAAGDAGITGVWVAGTGGSGGPGLLFLGGGLLLVAAAAFGPDGADDAASMPSRERIAVSAAVGPVVLVALAVAVYQMTTGSMPTTVGMAVLVLSGLLLARLIIASLDNLVLSRTLESQVAERTLELVTREQWFRSLIQHSSDVVTVIDVSGIVRYQSPAAERLFGHAPGSADGVLLSSLVRATDVPKLVAAVQRAVKMPGASFVLELSMAHSDGSFRDTETVITSLVDVPDVRGLVLNTRDVTDRKQLQERLTHQAFHDGLTGLANRTLFQQQLAAALADPSLGEVAVLFCDLDGFKAVNDSQGHDTGDTLLRLVSERLRGCVRSGDVVARFGGDEFAVLVQDREASRKARDVAERIAGALASPFALGDREVLVGVSIGIALADTDDSSADVLLRNADLAMYRAKADEQASVVVFEREMHDALLARLQVEDDLRAALGSGELVLHYQPTVELATGVAVGVEALMRWYRPGRGIVHPQEFITIAEENGYIDTIGQWALFEACRQAVAWQAHAPADRELFTVSVNISARQVRPNLVDIVAAALAESGLPAGALVLEMTESVLLGRTEEAVQVLHALKRLGVRIAIDDFGTGFSSLSYLSRFPVDVLKIDKAFVADVDRHGERAELASTIVQLGRTLRLGTIAEGIETQAQRQALLAMGCELGQGYLFSRPLPGNGVAVLLATGQGGAPSQRPAYESVAGA